MTVSPGTRIPPASVTVAVTVLSELPSARIDAGDSATVTFAAGPAANDAPPQHQDVASSASTPTINNRTRAINRRPAKRLPPQCLVSRNRPHHPQRGYAQLPVITTRPAPNPPRTIRMSRPNRHLARGNERHGASQPSLSAPARVLPPPGSAARVALAASLSPAPRAALQRAPPRPPCLTAGRLGAASTGTEYTASVVLGRGGKASALLGSAAVVQVGLGDFQFAAWGRVQGAD